MPDKLGQDLHAIIINICNNLFASRQLITNKIVKEQLLANGAWSEQEIELCLTKYINEWRLENLVEDTSLPFIERMHDLEQEVSKYKDSLRSAHKIIAKLKADLLAEATRAKLYRDRVIKELRGMLGVRGL